MSNHTKGPWRVSESGNDVEQDSEAGFGICAMYADESSSANARLIAAAPELLEACKDALALVRKTRQYFPKSIKNSDKFTLENTCATLGTAIHKATA